MADLRPIGCIENGTYVDTGGVLRVTLAGTNPEIGVVE